MQRLALLPTLTLLLSACATPYRIPAYTSLPTNSAAIAAAGAMNGVGFGQFEEVSFDRSCRGLQTIALPDDSTPSQYIRNALELELGAAGITVGNPRKVTLSGKVESIAFSSSAAITMGVWMLELTLRSSNGKAIRVSESFEFDSGFAYQEACDNVAKAFPKAVQNLLGSVIRNPGFPELIR